VSYDTALAVRIRAALGDVIEVTERPMFGGLAFLVRGHMTVLASSRGGMMIRADPATSTKLTETTPARRDAWKVDGGMAAPRHRGPARRRCARRLGRRRRLPPVSRPIEECSRPR
jgi:hypothetical protein